MNKYYGLTNPYSKGVKDKCPEWMGEILNIEKKTLSVEKINEIKTITTNIAQKNKSHCTVCGNVLLEREIGKCGNCRIR